MGLSTGDKIKHFIPAALYYPSRVAKLARGGEPELQFLSTLVPAGCVALDVGANRGCYSYALLKQTNRVEAFEPHPELVRFIRRKLGRRIRIHEVALSNHVGKTMLRIPQIKGGVDVHFNSSLKHVYDYAEYIETPVSVTTIDDLSLHEVGFIKIDVEGSDMDVIDGGRQTIARDRPNMVVEITHHTHADPAACIEHVKSAFDYDARIVMGDRLLDAFDVMRRMPMPDHTCNIVFIPK